jgi:hypothetical protein
MISCNSVSGNTVKGQSHYKFDIGTWATGWPTACFTIPTTAAHKSPLLSVCLVGLLLSYSTTLFQLQRLCSIRWEDNHELWVAKDLEGDHTPELVWREWGNTWKALERKPVIRLRFKRVKLKVKFSLCLIKFYAMKTYPLLNKATWNEDVFGEWRISVNILNFGTTWRWVISFTLRPPYARGKSPRTRWIGGWVDIRARLDVVTTKKSHHCPFWELNPCRPARSLKITILTEVPRLWLNRVSPKNKIHGTNNRFGLDPAPDGNRKPIP